MFFLIILKKFTKKFVLYWEKNGKIWPDFLVINIFPD